MFSLLVSGVPPGLLSTSTFLSSFRRSIWLLPGVIKTFVTRVDSTLELGFRVTRCRSETVTSGFCAFGDGISFFLSSKHCVFFNFTVSRSLTVICMGPSLFNGPACRALVRSDFLSSTGAVGCGGGGRGGGGGGGGGGGRRAGVGVAGCGGVGGSIARDSPGVFSTRAGTFLSLPLM